MKLTLTKLMLRLPVTLVIAVFGLLPDFGSAGTINVDCQNNAGTVATQGILPAGPTWNQLDNSDTTFPLKSDNNITLPNTGTASGSLSTSIDPGANPIQADSISRSGGGDVSVSIYGLRPGKYYKLVVYSSADSAGSSTVTIASGPSKTTTGNATNPASVGSMIEGRDYLVFESLKAGAGGDIGFSISHPSFTKLAGYQLQGWLEDEAFPHKTDLQISKKRNSGYKGDNRYTGAQRQTDRGKGKGKFYFRLQNDGGICGTYGARSKGSDKKARRKYFDLSEGRSNVTASIKSGQFQMGMSPAESATIQAIVKPKRDRRRVVTVFRGVSCDDSSSAFGDAGKAIFVRK